MNDCIYIWNCAPRKLVRLQDALYSCIRRPMGKFRCVSSDKVPSLQIAEKVGLGRLNFSCSWAKRQMYHQRIIGLVRRGLVSARCQKLHYSKLEEITCSDLIGPDGEKPRRLKAKWNWFQMLRDYFTIGLTHLLPRDTGRDEHNTEESAAGLHDSDSIWTQSGLGPVGSVCSQYRRALKFAAQ
jgi:hypothetical protein